MVGDGEHLLRDCRELVLPEMMIDRKRIVGRRYCSQSYDYVAEPVQPGKTNIGAIRVRWETAEPYIACKQTVI